MSVWFCTSHLIPAHPGGAGAWLASLGLPEQDPSPEHPIPTLVCCVIRPGLQGLLRERVGCVPWGLGGSTLRENSLPQWVGQWDSYSPDTGSYLLTGMLKGHLIGSGVFPSQIQPVRVLPGAQRVRLCCPLPSYFAAGRFGAAESLEGTKLIPLHGAKGSSAAAEEPCSGKSRGVERWLLALLLFGVSKATLPSTAAAFCWGLKCRFPTSPKKPRATAVVVCFQQAWPRS